MAYSTLDEKDLAKSLGFQITEDSQFGTRFVKQQRHIWPTKEGWQSADLIHGYYCNHLHFKNLKDALYRK